MDLFQSILSTIKQKLDIETLQTEKIASVVSTVIGIPITSAMIIVKGTKLTLIIPPTMRMKITLKRQTLLLALQENNLRITSIN